MYMKYAKYAGVINIVVGNGLGDPSSNPERWSLHFTTITPLTMVIIVGLFSLDMATDLGEGKIRPLQPSIKNNLAIFDTAHYVL